MLTRFITDSLLLPTHYIVIDSLITGLVNYRLITKAEFYITEAEYIAVYVVKGSSFETLKRHAETTR